MNGPRVLLVDDNPSDRMIVKALAEKSGFVTTEVGNAFEALEALNDEQMSFGLLVVDLQMPKLPGLELVRRIRRIEKMKSTPILIMSGRNRPIDVHAAISSGANDYIIKPVDLQVMEEKMQRLTTSNSGDWKLYEVPPELNSSQFSFFCVTKSLNELGAEVLIDFELPPNQTLNLTLEPLAAKGLRDCIVKVDKVLKNPKGGFVYKVSFIGLSEADRKKIRLVCREMHTQLAAAKAAG